jgi:hypothetical protein
VPNEINLIFDIVNGVFADIGVGNFDSLVKMACYFMA